MDELQIKVNEKLSCGDKIKNYKELCKLLELPVCDGNSKKSQLLNLERYISFEKEKNAFIINEIYKTPKEKVDKRFNPDNDFITTCIESLLLLDFMRQDTIAVEYTKKQLWDTLGMVNACYKSLGYIALKKGNDALEPWMLNNFYKRTRNIFDNKIKIALKRLEQKQLISWKEEVYKYTKEEGHQIVDDELELSLILECKRHAIDELVGSEKYHQNIDGSTEIVMTSIKDIIYNKNENVNYEAYMDLLDRKLQDELGIDYVYKKYRIILNKNYLPNATEINLNIIRNKLNNKIIDIIDNDADRVQKTRFYECIAYSEIQRYLSQKLLKIDIPNNLIGNLDSLCTK